MGNFWQKRKGNFLCEAKEQKVTMRGQNQQLFPNTAYREEHREVAEATASQVILPMAKESDGVLSHRLQASLNLSCSLRGHLSFCCSYYIRSPCLGCGLESVRFPSVLGFHSSPLGEVRG